MARGVFDPNFEDLPGLIPVFPLAGVLLLPQGHLPLQIFERRYLAMTRDALLAPTRLIGMIQPTGLADGPNGPELFPVGTAGRIINFAETEDGRYHIVLAGLIRFRVRDEVDLKDGYRRVMPNFLPYKDDLDIYGTVRDPSHARIDRDRILAGLKRYFGAKHVEANWDAIRQMDDRALVTTLAMSCPFEPADKQALLESIDIATCGHTLAALLEMGAGSAEAGFGDSPPPPTRH